MTSLSYPQPAELTPEQIEERKVAQRLGQAVADQHRGISIAEEVVDDGYILMVQHAAHSWPLKVLRADGDNPTSLENKAKRKAMAHYLDRWQRELLQAQEGTEATNAAGDKIATAEAVIAFIDLARRTAKNGRKLIFLGNGGSSAIAGHMAEDFTKNGGIRAVTFNETALLTCFANDYGWEDAFKECIAEYGDAGDLLVAISSSGKSPSIVRAAEWAKGNGIGVVTFSGFTPENPLRKLGILNFWVPSMQYGFVETAHAAWLHAALDMHMGWVGQK